MLDVVGYAAAVLMGISLGLIGGGGSIFTVPIFVYLFHQPAELAITQSLFVVGTVSLTGSLQHIRQQNFAPRAALLMGIPSVASVMVMRKLLLPLVPEVLVSTQRLTVTRSHVLLLLFACIMLAAAWSMIRKPVLPSGDSKSSFQLILRGCLVGLVMGLLGAGGGFLLVPALVFMAGLDMKKAIGTSLVLIAANALMGFVSSASDWQHLNRTLLFSLTAVALAGIVAGSHLSKKFTGEKLKRLFGYVVLMMAIFILVKESVSLF